MKKIILFVVVLTSMVFSVSAIQAQDNNSATGTQSVTLKLEPVIQITAVSTENVNLGFNSITNYINGVESGSQQFKIHSNKDYVISVRADASSFSYSGSTQPSPVMPVSNTLFLSISENNTGGNIVSSFNNFASLSEQPKPLLINCKQGGDKTFSVNYKAVPGPQYPAGDYTVGVIYTATQP